MRYRVLPGQISLSKIVLGTGGYGTGMQDDAAFEQMDAYYSAGGRTLDTARVYGKWAEGGDGASEKCIGRWLKSRGVRNSMTISTKGAHFDLNDIRIQRVNPACIRSDLNESLEFLGTDSVELYFLHRDDERVPVGEIMDALDEQVHAGRIRLLGASNWRTQRIAEANVYAAKHGKTPFSVSQIEWSYAKLQGQIYDPRDTTVYMTDAEYGWYLEHEFPVMAYSSQAKGLFSKLAHGAESLPESMREVYATPVNQARYRRAKKIADQYGVSTARVALAYLLCDPLNGSAIIGASKMTQLTDSLAANELLLTPEEFQYLSNDSLQEE